MLCSPVPRAHPRRQALRKRQCCVTQTRVKAPATAASSPSSAKHVQTTCQHAHAAVPQPDVRPSIAGDAPKPARCHHCHICKKCVLAVRALPCCADTVVRCLTSSAGGQPDGPPLSLGCHVCRLLQLPRTCPANSVQYGYGVVTLDVWHVFSTSSCSCSICGWAASMPPSSRCGRS